MKSFLIIGLGRFGTHLCKDLSKLDNEIMVVDENEAVMEDVLSFVTSAKIGDCTNEKVLATLGVGNFDVCFVCIGSNFQSTGRPAAPGAAHPQGEQELLLCVRGQRPAGKAGAGSHAAPGG